VVLLSLREGARRRHPRVRGSVFAACGVAVVATQRATPCVRARYAAGDLLDLDPTTPGSSAGAGGAAAGGGFDLFVAPAAPVMPVLASKDGFIIRGAISRSGGRAVLETIVENATGRTVGQCALKFKANKMGIVPEGNAIVYANIPTGSSGAGNVLLSCIPGQQSADALTDKVRRCGVVVRADGALLSACLAALCRSSTLHCARTRRALSCSSTSACRWRASSARVHRWSAARSSRRSSPFRPRRRSLTRCVATAGCVSLCGRR
jgi:hypothetical protein